MARWKGGSQAAFALSRPGDLAVAGGSARLPLPFDCTLLGASAAIGQVANDDVIIDINRNGVSIFADANDRPAIIEGQYLSPAADFLVEASAGDYLTVDVDQAGTVADVEVIAATDSNKLLTGTNAALVATRPGTAATGDLQIAAIVTTVGGTVGSTTEPPTTITVPSGWTQIGTPTRSQLYVGARAIDLHLYRWVDDGSQPTWTFTVTQPTVNSYARARVLTLRGVDTSAAINVSDTAAPARSSVSWQSDSVTTTEDGTLLLGIWATSAYVTAPAVSGMTLIGDVDTSSVNTTLNTFTQQLGAEGATGTRTMTGTPPFGVLSVVALIAVTADPDVTVPGSDLTVTLRYRPA